MITRSLKKHAGLTEIAGGLGTAHLLGENDSDGAASWMSQWMLVKPSMVSYVAPLDILLLAMDTFPGKQYLGLIHVLQLCESPVIFLPSITPESYPVAVTLDSTQIFLNPAPLNLPRMENDLQLYCGL